MRCLRAAEFLNASGIKPKPPTGLPAVINVKLPEACTHLKTDYTCRGKYKVMINMLTLGQYLYFSWLDAKLFENKQQKSNCFFTNTTFFNFCLKGFFFFFNSTQFSPLGQESKSSVAVTNRGTLLMTCLYACVTSEGGVGVNKTELKPYTDYSCVGNIETEDGSIKTTDKVKFQIDCGTLSFTFLL